MSKFRSKEAQIVANQCDLRSTAELAAPLEGCADAGMPRIKGYVSAAVSQQDAAFEGTRHGKRECAIWSNVNSSRNLQPQPLREIDFFISLSSLSSLYGSLARSNRAADRTFQDALPCYGARWSLA
ncbi:polyketide synthase [Durotheca rogersii]|uniref:polyketide synthase n=1 Tax=Durotheca rogersii TaxID=419775 RepID=UPI0022211215|nr:polyketide synthase [Durotheca rogersii]KAI5865643.1 polyketide synthase [Durotheca rogersii]